MNKITVFVMLFFACFLSMGTTYGDALHLRNLVDTFNGQNDGLGMNVLFADGGSDSSAAGRSGIHSIGLTSSDAGEYLSAYLSPHTYNGTWQDNYEHLGNLRTGEVGGDSRLFFNTFCVDRSTGTRDNTYVNATLSFVDNGDGTYKTNVDTASSGDRALTLGAALLYQDMLLGKLDMTPWVQEAVTESWRNDPVTYIDQFGTYDIQSAIWAFQTGSLENMLNSGANTADYVEIYAHATDYLQSIYGDMFDDELWWFGDYDPINHSLDGYSVLAVNMTSENGGSFQDHIILVPNVPASTPEPASVLIFGIGLTGIGWAARRREKTRQAA